MRRAAVLLVALFVLPFLATGCPEAARTVSYSKPGAAHCPECKTTQVDGTVVCAVCETSLRWSAKISECWHCDGSGICQVCNGHALIGPSATVGETCFACERKMGKDAYSPGSCPHCEGSGMVETGGS